MSKLKKQRKGSDTLYSLPLTPSPIFNHHSLEQPVRIYAFSFKKKSKTSKKTQNLEHSQPPFFPCSSNPRHSLFTLHLSTIPTYFSVLSFFMSISSLYILVGYPMFFVVTFLNSLLFFIQ